MESDKGLSGGRGAVGGDGEVFEEIIMQGEVEGRGTDGEMTVLMHQGNTQCLKVS